MNTQCVDITFVKDNDPRLGNVNETNCFNSTDIGFAEIYTITTKESGSTANVSISAAVSTFVRSSYSSWLGFAPLLLGALFTLV